VAPPLIADRAVLDVLDERLSTVLSAASEHMDVGILIER